MNAGRAWLDLARAGNFPSVASNVLAALTLSALVPGMEWPLFGVALLAGILAYAGGATLNDVFDARFDAAHRPERAIPRGVVSRNAALAGGVAEMLLGSALLLVLGANSLAVAGMIAVILLYDWLHKRWTGSVFLMAGCRALLAVALATIPGHAPGTWFLGWTIALFIYIVILSLLARREYKSGNPQSGRAIARLLAFIPLIDAIALALFGAWIPAIACALAVPLGKWTQRLAAAT